LHKINLTVLMKKNIAFSILFSIISIAIYSQKATVKGKVKDATTGETIPFAGVYLESNTSVGTTTDFDGNYQLKIDAGKHNIVYSFTTYNTIIKSVTVEAGEVLELNVEMTTAEGVLESLDVVAEKTTNTDNAVVLEMREAKSVVSGISREQISRSQDRNAAEVMQRIPGVTIVQNRFVMIRGISSRYNNVMINNVVAPSTEVDRRTFSFDLISSGALDRMYVYKSAAPDYPGDFAGGVIKLFTVNSVDEEYMSFTINTGYRPGTTFAPYYQSKGSKTDFLGFDRSFRTLPSSFPTTDALANERTVSEVRRDAAHTLPNNFMPIERLALPDYGFAFNFGKIMSIKDKKLTTNTSINYSTGYQSFVRDFYRYFQWVDQDIPITQRFKFEDYTYQKEQKVNIMSNWTLHLNPRSKITFYNLFNQIGENETILRRGEDFIQRPGEDLHNYLLGYKSRTIYLSQLVGTHDLDREDKQQISWVVGASYIGESEPDLRRFRTYKPSNEDKFVMQLPPSSNLFETGRYFGDLSELMVSNGLNYTYNFNTDKEKKRTLKLGYYTDYRSRQFSSRYFSYLYPGFFDPSLEQELRRLPLDQIFANENIKTQDGFVLAEGTRPIDSYNASNFLSAIYAATDLQFGDLNVSGGLRTEYNIQNLYTRSDFELITVNNPIFSLLPSLNLAYNITEKTILRMGYGRTVNRPEFRELAPFLFYDYKLEAGRVGNPNLKIATIDNFDLRYEYYPRAGEIISLGGFYKRFINPIEDRTIITTEQPTFTYINADFAYNYGAELELRKSLKDLTGSQFLNNLSFNANASYIVSRVDLGATAVAQDRVRALQGQSPYIVNTAIYYNNDKSKIMASIIYNVFGRSIYSVGDDIFPTIYELERHSIDVTFGKTFDNGMNFKMGIQDVLNYRYRFYQDSDRNGIIDSRDNPIFTFRRGSLFSFSATYSFKPNKKKDE
jgi:hypothetical protein